MKTILYKIAFMALLLPTLSFCSTPGSPLNGKITKQKKVSRKFSVSAKDFVKIDNSYGNVDLSTWDQNTVSIEVIIKTNGNDEQKVQERLDDISVEFNQSSGTVSARTRFSKGHNSSWWDKLFGDSNNVNMEVNYIIKAPATNNVDINNDYGSIIIDKLKGNANLSCDYGSLNIGELHGDSNHLSFDYSRNSHFGYINKAIINADYSEFTIEDAHAVDLKADYTDSKFNKIELLQFSCDYGSLSVQKVKQIKGSGDYLGSHLGEIFQSADLSMDYGNLSIEKIVKGAGNININTDYAGIKIGYAQDQAFSFDIKTSYASVKGLEGFELQRQSQSSSDRSYSGFHLDKNNSSLITIRSDYGGVTFEQK
ncbi:MAG: hypothetical protein WCD31_08420 [Gillisia sp.]